MSKPVKPEATQAMARLISTTTNVQSLNGRKKPISSGENTMADSDVTIQDEQFDEGYSSNHAKNTASQESRHPTAESQVISPDGGVHILGRGVKELVQAVQELRHLGVEDLNLPLPKIVVVGDQSTGKSSLIEGMSEIKVPRKAGTCTRCPLEINLAESPSGNWVCKVSLFKKYLYEGNLGSAQPQFRGLAKSEGATRARPLGPWSVQDPEDFHFATITSKSDVPDVLYRAQLATLNPGSDYEKYMPGKPAPIDYHQVKFSPNIVRLDISGPDLPNLSFYDLPGVINVSDISGEEYLVTLVKNLVKAYISADDSLNLLAIPMTDDPANSSALRLVRELKAESRTIGCLTKPDRRQEGECLDQWIEILQGERFRLGHGYYVVKNNPDATVDHAVARREEAHFFEDSDEASLRSAISLYTSLTLLCSLPRIITQVHQKAEMIDAALKELPEPLHGNLPAIVLGELMKFEKELQKHMDGGREFPFQKAWNEKATRFRKVLAETKPMLSLSNPERSMRFNLNDSPARSGVQESPSPSSRKAATITINTDDDSDVPTQRSRVQRNKRPHSSTQSTPIKSQRSSNTTPTSRPVSVGVRAKLFDVAEVNSLIQDAYVGGVPDQTHPMAIEEMIVLSMTHWQGPLDHFLKETQELCESMVFELVQAVFGHRQHTRYFDLILECCRTFFEEAFSQQRQLLNRILAWEMSKPRTLNDEAMCIARDKALTILQSYSREVRAREYVEEQEAKTGKATDGAARKEKAAKVADVQLRPEVYGREIHAMSVVKAFYEGQLPYKELALQPCHTLTLHIVAYSRFVDVVCSSMHYELLCKCRNELFPEMIRRFGVTDPGANERFAILLAANARDEERRAVLMKEKDKIEKAQERLDGL
ncbi:MAG: hypothetical protein Q9163_004537 [Psora crenata]